MEAGDDRAIYVKLADRVHNMRTTAVKSLASQERIAKETLQCFVLQAQRLGLEAVVLGVFFPSVPQTVSLKSS